MRVIRVPNDQSRVDPTKKVVTETYSTPSPDSLTEIVLGLFGGGASRATSYRYSPGDASIAPVLASAPRLPYLPRTDRTNPLCPTSVESTG